MKISLKELKTIIKNVLEEDVYDLDRQNILNYLEREKDSSGQLNSSGETEPARNIYKSFETTFKPEQHGNMVLIKINDPNFYDVEKPFELINKSDIKNQKFLNFINRFQDKKIILVNNEFYEDTKSVLEQDSFSGNYLLHDLAHTIYTEVEPKMDEAIAILQKNIRIFLLNSLGFHEDSAYAKTEIYSNYGFKTVDLDEFIRGFFSDNIDLNLSSNYTSSDVPFGIHDRFPNIIKHAKEEILKLDLLTVNDLQNYIQTKAKKEINDFKNDQNLNGSFNNLKEIIKEFFDKIKTNISDKNVVNLIGVDSTKLKSD